MKRSLLDALRRHFQPVAEQKLQRHEGQDGEDVHKARGANQGGQMEGHDSQGGHGDHEIRMAPVEERQGPEMISNDSIQETHLTVT